MTERKLAHLAAGHWRQVHRRRR